MREASLKELRELGGLTQARAARMARVDRSILSQIENGEIKASGATLTKIRRLLVRVIARRRARIDAALNSEDGRGHSTERLRSAAAE